MVERKMGNKISVHELVPKKVIIFLKSFVVFVGE